MIADGKLRARYGFGRSARARRAGPTRTLAAWLPRPGRTSIVAAVITVALLGGAFLWLRDSPLVAVKRVSVSGLSGPDAGRIRAALVLAGENMTTLDVHMDQLRSAVGPYPVVKDIRVSTQFPHGMRIRVIEQIPVGVVVVDGRRIAVAGDGTLLHDMTASSSLPVVPLRVPPGGTRLTDHDALGAVAVLAAAPYQLLQRISTIATSDVHGLTADLRSGPNIYFGDASALGAKWTAVATVLADPGSAGAVYVDVSDPERPAAGGVGPPSSSSSSGASGTGGTATPQTTMPQTTLPATTTPTGG